MAWRAQPNEAFLRLVFRSAVGSVLAGSVYVAAAPGGAQPAPTPAATAAELDTSPIGQRPCDPQQPIDVHLLHPRVKLDYLSSRSGGRIGQAVGLPCRGAADRDSCDAAIAKADAARSGRGHYLLGTSGNRVLTWDDADEFLALVGRLEDAQAATDFLRMKRIANLMCPVQQIADGFLVDTRETTQTKSYDSWFDVERGMTRRLHLSENGKLTVLWSRPFERKVRNGAIDGRRPPGLVSAGPRVGSVGAHFARAAMHEAASVRAFTILAAELRAHGASAQLVRRCEDAAHDEVRHAEQMSRLARRFGHQPLHATIESVPLRSLSELAFDNAVEGCVHETYAALLAVYQARCARDPAVATELSLIADDETRHAMLSWDIDRWLRPRLTSELQTAVHRAQLEAAADLRNVRDLIEDEGERRLAGLPSRAHSHQLIESLSAQLWAA